MKNKKTGRLFFCLSYSWRRFCCSTGLETGWEGEKQEVILHITAIMP